MERRPKPYSRGENVKTSRISRLCLRGVSNAPQLLPDSGIHCPSSFPLVENPIDETQDSPSPLPMQAHGSDLNTTQPNNGTHGSSPLSFLTDNHGNSPNTASLANSSPRPAGPHAIPATSTGTSLLPGARDFVMNVNIQGDSNTIIRGMKALSKRVIEGAEYDSSLRDPPPQCHPGTRVELMEKILAWFRNGGREKALLWLSGPAGVGKSAIIQTVAESLAESNYIGATLFFSRLNNRNDPQRVFITLAFQLATNIPAYRMYITERIALNLSLLGKGMKEQFRVFITEPFGNNGIGKGEGPWAILLDGLDECEGVGEQLRIISLVSEFVLKFPNAPLMWTIASRPEPHIVATFNDEAVDPSYWSEYVPIDSTQACKDVEHYLDANVKAMRKSFPHLPPTWPSESQFLKLSNSARDLFVFARTAVRFMEDPDFADPVSRLNLILLVIDRLDVKLIDDHPFALLDALYTQILASIPSSVWPTTKRLLGLKAASIIFGFELSVAYGSLHKLHSVLDIPNSIQAYVYTARFLHASFGDYLVDRVRSKDFYIDRGEAVDGIVHALFQLYLNKLSNTEWKQYTSQFPPPIAPIFGRCMLSAVRSNLRWVLTGELQSKRGRGPLKSQQDRSDCLDALGRINLAEIYESVFHGAVATFMIELWKTFQEELGSTGRFEEVPLSDLKVDHLNDDRNEIVFARKDGYAV